MQLIKNKAIVEDTYQVVAADATEVNVPAGDVIVPLTLWKANREALIKHDGKLGVALLSSEAIDDILDDLSHFAVIALEFPLFKDGRHYSSAKLLRDRYGYQGEIRAYGDVNRDQLFYMNRVGFDAFQLRAEADLNVALTAFNDFSVRYQASHDETIPLYRRR